MITCIQFSLKYILEPKTFLFASEQLAGKHNTVRDINA